MCENKPWQTAVPGTANTPDRPRPTSAIWERGGKAAGLPVRGGGLPAFGPDQGPRHTLVHAAGLGELKQRHQFPLSPFATVSS